MGGSENLTGFKVAVCITCFVPWLKKVMNFIQ